MNEDPRSHGLWEASAPPAPPTPPLDDEVEADVVVIGAGYTGLSAALHAAQAGAGVVVLEAAEIGYGGSGRNVGLVNAGLWVMPEALVNALGEPRGARLLQQLGEAPSLVFELIRRHAIDCEAVRNGTLHCAVGARGRSEIEERARQWLRRGAPVRLLDEREAAEALGTRAYRAALLDERAGTIQPLAYARGLAQAARAAGARLHGRTPVTSVEDLGSRWRVRTSRSGAVRARWILVTTNAYAVPGGPWPGLAGELVRLPYFNLATGPLAPHLAQSVLPGRQGAWDTRRVLSSFRLDAAGRLIFGSVGALRGSGRVVHAAWGRRALARLFPRLADVEFEHAWYGMIGMTGNALPRLHLLGRHVVSISGYNGRGIGPGTSFGRDLARLALGQVALEDLALPATPVRAAAFKPLREACYEMGAQAVHLAAARRRG